jgi:hypothetical protein
LRADQTRRAGFGANFPLVMLIEIIHGGILSGCRITLCNGLHDLIFAFANVSWRHFFRLSRELCSKRLQNEFPAFSSPNDFCPDISHGGIFP